MDVQYDKSTWPEYQDRIAAILKTKPLAEWLEIFKEADACVAPVLNLEQSLEDEHLLARSAYIPIGDTTQPAPAPRFSLTPSVAYPGREITAAEALHSWNALA